MNIPGECNEYNSMRNDPASLSSPGIKSSTPLLEKMEHTQTFFLSYNKMSMKMQSIKNRLEQHWNYVL
jgi:hypothetical protein